LQSIARNPQDFEQLPNSGEKNLTDVVITENYPNGVTFFSASPPSDHETNNKGTRIKIGD
jgi:hypothetical protein